MATAAAKAALAEGATVAARPSVQALRNTHGVVNMPTRAIAAVLLKNRVPVPHDELYELSDEYGLFKSKRHFKHCLKMMKQQDRVQVICNGPEYPGASRLSFSVKLTRRGDAIYTRYLGTDVPNPTEDDAPSLTNAT